MQRVPTVARESILRRKNPLLDPQIGPQRSADDLRLAASLLGPSAQDPPIARKVQGIRIPARVKWKPKNAHKFFAVPLDSFMKWITDPHTGATRDRS